MMAKNKSEFDGPWKDILDIYFEEFIAFCWPSKYHEIDWTKGFKMRDKELTKISRGTKTGRKVVDKLVEVYLKNGDSALILMHIEIQKNKEIIFTERMFTYRIRLWDRYRTPIVSLAILIDDNKNWRPNVYRDELWDSSIEMHFPIIKILDYSDQIEELEASANPFAAVILAQLAAMKKETPLAKLDTKIQLIKLLYKKGWKKDDLIALLQFLDWIIALPLELELQCTKTAEKIEEESKMNYVTSFERIGIQKGIKKGIEQGIEQGKVLGESEMLVKLLKNKFRRIPKQYSDKIKQANPDRLISWAMKLLRAPKIEDVFAEEDTLITS